MGVGALVGSLAVASLGSFRRKGLLLAAGSLIFPLALLSFAQTRYLPLSLTCLAVVGFGFVMQNATSNTLVQSIVPDDLRGEVGPAFDDFNLALELHRAYTGEDSSSGFGPAADSRAAK